MNLHTIDMKLFRGDAPAELLQISKILKDGGFECYLVGGAIRDILHYGVKEGEHVREGDYDFATSAHPKQVMKLFKSLKIFTVPTGLQHGTVVVVINDMNFEITTFRIEEGYSDGRHPDNVEFSDDIITDLSRRDFTVNAMAYDVLEHKLIDPFGGKADIEKKIIRTVGSPLERFNEDGLRPVRACRFAATLGYRIEEETLSAIPQTLEVIKKVSKERFRDEILKLMKAKKPSVGLEYMRETGILDFLMPELMEGYGIDQNEYHEYDVYWHNLHACDAASRKFPLVRLAALLHDIGKPRSKDYALKHGNGNVFYNHQIIGERMAKKMLRRLKFSNTEIAFITHLIHLHMFYYTEDWTDGAVRRFLRNFDGDISFLDALFELRRADRMGSGTKKMDAPILKKFRKRIEKILQQDAALKVTDLDINGKDLMEHFKLSPGKIIGETLNVLLEEVLDEPSLNHQEKLLEIAKNFLSEREEEEA